MSSQVGHLANCPGHGKDRRSRIALLAVRAIPAAMHMVLANIVFAGKGVFEVSRALIKRCSLRAAALSVVNTRGHFTLAFNYSSESSTNLGEAADDSNLFLITKTAKRNPIKSPSKTPFKSSFCLYSYLAFAGLQQILFRE
jgi:hypothetical protein